MTTTESVDRLEPIHPGEVLMEDFIKGFGVTQHRVAVAIGVPPRRINEIVHGSRGVSADTALRPGRYVGTTAQFWLNSGLICRVSAIVTPGCPCPETVVWWTSATPAM